MVAWSVIVCVIVYNSLLGSIVLGRLDFDKFEDFIWNGDLG